MNSQSHLTEEQIAQCVDAMNRGNYDLLPEVVRKHVEECNECAHEILMVSEITEEIENEIVSVKKKTTKRYYLRPVVYAAASLAIITTAYVFLKLNQETLSNSIAVNPVNKDTTNLSSGFGREPKDTTHQVIKQKVEPHSPEPTKRKKSEMLAYTPNPQLEKLVENFRGTYRGGDITVTSLELTISPDTDSLKWKNPGSITMVVEILDVMGEKVFETDTRQSGIKIPSLKKGLYYWKLMNQDFDLHYVGKIRVE